MIDYYAVIKNHVLKEFFKYIEKCTKRLLKENAGYKNSITALFQFIEKLCIYTKMLIAEFQMDWYLKVIPLKCSPLTVSILTQVLHNDHVLFLVWPFN